MTETKRPAFQYYPKDWMTNDKLNECSMTAHGLMINMMNILHFTQEYGVLLLKQKDKQRSSATLNFAFKISRRLPFGVDEIQKGLEELLEEGVLKTEGDELKCYRMIKDEKIRRVRAKAGSKGGTKTQFAKAKPQANSNQIAGEEEGDAVVEAVVLEKDQQFVKWFKDYDKEIDEEKCWDYWRRSMKPQDKDACEQITPAYVKTTPLAKYRMGPFRFLIEKKYLDKGIVKNFEENGDWIEQQRNE